MESIVLAIKNDKRLPIYIWHANHEPVMGKSEVVTSYYSQDYQTTKGVIKQFYKKILLSNYGEGFSLVQ